MWHVAPNTSAVLHISLLKHGQYKRSVAVGITYVGGSTSSGITLENKRCVPASVSARIRGIITYPSHKSVYHNENNMTIDLDIIRNGCFPRYATRMAHRALPWLRIRKPSIISVEKPLVHLAKKLMQKSVSTTTNTTLDGLRWTP